MKHFKSLITLALASSTLAACGEDVGSSAIRTKGIYANFEAVATGDGSTDFTAELRVGGDDGTFVELDGEDTLTASFDEDSKQMTKNSANTRHRYSAGFGEETGGALLNISFNRGSEDDDATDSVALLPEPYALTFVDIDEDDSVQRGNDIAIEWSNEDPGDMYWSIEGSCIWTESGTTSDDKEFTISAEKIRVQSTDEGEDCDVTVTLERINAGDTDPKFEEGGSFEAIQRRAIQFVSTPADDETGGAGGAP